MVTWCKQEEGIENQRQNTQLKVNVTIQNKTKWKKYAEEVGEGGGAEGIRFEKSEKKKDKIGVLKKKKRKEFIVKRTGKKRDRIWNFNISINESITMTASITLS